MAFLTRSRGRWMPKAGGGGALVAAYLKHPLRPAGTSPALRRRKGLPAAEHVFEDFVSTRAAD